ncbi:hypothetical protein V6N11_046732 [Hibiscus sabdariffa]|uniref:Uncharacterized protein n=1 Tax=Hibiscus sabdariffa TaxID=183260 RepID=A0ABR2NGJ1_9ROSI
MVRLAGALPFLLVDASGMVRSAEAQVAGVGASDMLELQLVPSSLFAWQLSSLVPALAMELGRLAFADGLTDVLVEWQRRSRLGVFPRVGHRRSWLLIWRICIRTASSDWTGGGDDGVLGAEPKGKSGVDCLLACMAAGVDVGLGTGNTCGVAAGVDRAAAGADGPASSGAAAGEWAGLAGGVGIATMMGAASTTSIFRMYSFLDQPAFSAVYLSPGWVGSCKLMGNDFPNIEAVARHDDVYQHQPSAIDCLVMGEEVLDGLVVFFFKSLEQCIDARLIVGQAEYFIDVEVGSGWFSCEAKLAEFTQPSMDGGLQAIVLKAVVEEEPLFFPSILCTISGISFLSFCVGRLVGHALEG